MPTPKPSLSSHLKEGPLARFESVARASAELGIPYERLKKSIRENKYSVSDLSILMPGRTPEDLSNQFEFEYSRRYTAVASSAGFAETRHVDLKAFAPIYTPFETTKRAVKETEFQNFVDDLYDAMTDGCSMFLFCDIEAKPIEWKLDKDVVSRIESALSRGAVIVYVFDQGFGDEFDIFVQALHRQRMRNSFESTQTSENQGFIATLTVDRCAFCTPYQKSALLNLIDGNDVALALTVVDIPEALDGHGHLGSLVLPLTENVAAKMRLYLNRIVLNSTNDRLPDGYEVRCYPEMSEAEFIKRLSEVV